MRRKNRFWLAGLLFGLTLALLAVWLWLVLATGRSRSATDISTLSFIAFPLMGLLIIRRQPGHPMGWLFMLEGLFAGGALAGNMYALVALDLWPGILPAGDWIALAGSAATILLWAGFFALIMLFPTGRLPSTRWKPFGWFAMTLVSLQALLNFLLPGLIDLNDGTLPRAPNPLALAWLGGLAPVVNVVDALVFPTGIACLLAPLLRFRSARGDERQQLKWLGLLAAFLAFYIGFYGLDQALGFAVSARAILGAVGNVIPAAVTLVMAIAILRYRLYDIDLIIRRTLVYAVLTAVLGGVYFGGVALAQALLRPFTGAGSDLAIVMTTLGIAALALPLRRAVQRFIDRRFYRRRYDAARTLATFSNHVRDEVELEQLTARLVAVVEETMRPAQVSLWLRADSGRRAGGRSSTNNYT